MNDSKLGKGLDALFGDSPIPDVAPAAEDDVNVRMVSVDRLKPGRYQPRKEMDTKSLGELAESIRKFGILQPIVAMPVAGEDSYEIIAGERRWRAAQIAGCSTVPVSIQDLTLQDKVAVSLIENIQRKNLNPVEEARGLQQLVTEFKMTHKQVAGSIGRSRATITNQIRLLALAGPVLNLLERGDIETGHAKVLLSLSSSSDQLSAAKLVVKKSLSVRQTEQLVKNWVSPANQKQKVEPARNADIAGLENELSDKIGYKVAIRDNNGKGFVQIRYHNLDELDGILSHFN